MKKLKLLLPLLILAGCSTAQITETGTNVKLVEKAPENKSCNNLGPVFGKGGGAFGGAWISDQKLMEYASNDLRNKASQKGATHVVISSHQMGQTNSKYGGSTSTATYSGIAYQCRV
jgi:hypothetical protein